MLSRGEGAHDIPGITAPPEHKPPEFSDEAIALGFAEENAEFLRYVSLWGRWMLWDDIRWVRDETLAARSVVRTVCRAAAEACDKPRVATELASYRKVTAVERLAQADRRLAASTDQWDRDPFVLNTPAGTIDLKTGDRSEQWPSDYITRCTASSPGGACPAFMRFLDRVTDRDSELQEFIQRMFGYALTGSTKEHALFFLYGTGANGKSVLLDTVSGILDDYHQTAQIETFTASNIDRHPTDLAFLHGARLVTAIETEEGRRWAESRIKALTGGDKIAARFMRQDFFNYVPQFKLVIAGNHKPTLRTVDEAIRRRFHLVPFTVTIPPDERDPHLTDKLKAEWPGILAWMLQGCAQWQQMGLAPPEAVMAATTAYLDEEDAFAQWLCECCKRQEGPRENVSDLFTSWKSWAEKAGEFVGSRKRFGQTMQERGFERHREPGTGQKGFEGISLIRPDYTDDPRYGD